MRCARARSAIVQRQLSLLSPREQVDLERHLRDCAACSAEAELEGRLAGDLLSLREEYPLELDVSRRVMAEIARTGEPERREVPDRQLVWSAIAATVATAALLATAKQFLPIVPEALQAMQVLASSALTVVTEVARPVLALLAIPFKLLGILLESVGGLSPLVDAGRPAMTSMTIVSCVLMTLTTFYVVGRDLRQLVTNGNREVNPR